MAGHVKKTYCVSVSFVFLECLSIFFTLKARKILEANNMYNKKTNTQIKAKSNRDDNLSIK